MMKNRHFKPCDAAIEIKNTQRQAEINVLSGFSKQGLIGRNLRGFDITKFYQAHPELLHEFDKTPAGRDYSQFIRMIIDQDIIELAKLPNDNIAALGNAFGLLHNQLTQVLSHGQFITCTHLVDEFTNCLEAMPLKGDNSLIIKAILDILSSIMTKLYEAKK